MPLPEAWCEKCDHNGSLGVGSLGVGSLGVGVGAVSGDAVAGFFAG